MPETPGRARPLEATVSRIDFGAVVLMADDGARIPAGVTGLLRGRKKSLGNTVVVGDRVSLMWEGDQAFVHAVAERRNAFTRRAAGEREEPQVIASSLDQVVVVAAMRQPDFKGGLVDRVVVQCAHEGIPVFLALNKVDLDDASEAGAILAEYAKAGIAGRALSARDGRGVEGVRDVCAGKRSLFVGHSGVGKSTLLSRLAPGLELLAGEVNEKTGKGRHTTSHALLLRLGGGTELIDTPGVRAFGLWGVDADTLVEYYPELSPYQGRCRFGDCRHDLEPGCAVREAYASGAIGERRWQSFLKLRAELEGGTH